MILSLFIWSGLFMLLGLILFWKRKPVLGLLFALIGLTGLAVGLVVVYLYPEKI